MPVLGAALGGEEVPRPVPLQQVRSPGNGKPVPEHVASGPSSSSQVAGSMRHRAIPAGPEKWTQHDHGPAGSGEVTKKESNPELLTQVVITQKRPSW
jgi:hypothetical protein